MARGVVVKFDRDRGHGVIRRDEDGISFFVHQSAIEGNGYRYLLPNEHVEFETRYNENKKRDEVAVVRAPEHRQKGAVKSFDHTRGFGWIRPDDGGQDVFLHFSEIIKTKGAKTAAEGDEVEFEVEESDRGPKAVRVKRLDDRLPLFRFCYLGPEERWLQALARKAEREKWYFGPEKDEPDYPILRSYLIYTFARLEAEDGDESKRGKKIAIGSENGVDYACFNTGLVTNNQEQIYALLSGKGPDVDGCKWKLDGFYHESEPMMLGKFHALPELAYYFDDPGVLLYDRRCELYINLDHIIDERIDRFPPYIKKNKYVARQLLESARRLTEQRVYRNYKTAIPQFYRGSVQLLLPLCLEVPNRADLALVVTRHGNQYRGSTALTLDMAYSNARLLARPDSDWLRP